MWVARDEDGSLCICNTKPIRISKKWYKGYWDHDEFDGMLEIKDKSLFPELKWEDEPIEVNLISTDNIDIELNDMFCQLCVDYKIPDSVADKLINIFKSNVGSKR